MGIAKNNVITAADINSKNKSIVTFQDDYQGRVFSDDEWSIPRSFASRSAGDWNVQVSFNTNSSNPKNDIEVWDSSNTVQYLEWDINDTSPSLNTGGWEYEWDSSSSWPRSFIVPQGDFIVKIGTAANINRVEVYLRMFQAQTDNAYGQTIRVWDDTWGSLLPEGDKWITVAVANSGVLGHE